MSRGGRSQDDYVADFAAECIRMVLSWLSSTQPGELVRFAIDRDDGGDRLEMRFTLDANPGAEFLYRQGVFAAGHEAQMSATSAVSLVLGALVERTAVPRHATEGLIDISWGASA